MGVSRVTDNLLFKRFSILTDFNLTAEDLTKLQEKIIEVLEARNHPDVEFICLIKILFH